jgi:hypothetical protein
MKYYYKLGDDLTVDFIPYTGESNYSGISVTKLTDSKHSTYIGGEITVIGYRLNTRQPFKKAKYNETYTLQTNKGMFVASKTYNDSGTGIDTTVPVVNYMIYNGTGIFKGKTRMNIKFHNNTIPKTRTITVS